jgi:hypothetical protein
MELGVDGFQAFRLLVKDKGRNEHAAIHCALDVMWP